MALRESLTVLNVAYPFAPVGPDAVGGAEQVLSAIDGHLTSAGHRSVVVACDGSVTAGVAESVPAPCGELTESVKRSVWKQSRAAISRALVRHRPDLIHLHGVDAQEYLPETNVPVLMTLHLPIPLYRPDLFTSARENVWFNCVSQCQRKTAPRGAQMLDLIANGVRIEPVAGHERTFCVALGRICPEKGFHLALSAARKARAAMLLAGHVFAYPEHVAYFEQHVRPLLDDCRRFIGAVGFPAKRRLLSRARCVLIPSLIEETSSLVAMEAMMCGVPVIGFRRGALPEIVEQGRTGFLVGNEDEMADAIHSAGDLNTEEIRHIARERFSAAAMCERYVEAYRRLVHHGCAVVR